MDTDVRQNPSAPDNPFKLVCLLTIEECVGRLSVGQHVSISYLSAKAIYT